MKKLSILLFLITLISCNRKEAKSEQINNTEQKIIVDSTTISSKNSVKMQSFEDFPEELDGPGCVFSFSKKEYEKGGNYVYSDDLDSICYIKIKGDFVRLRMVAIDTSWYPTMHYAKKFRNEDYKLSVDVKKIDEEDETSLLKGTLLFQYRNEAAEKKEIYGYCGC